MNLKNKVYKYDIDFKMNIEKSIFIITIMSNYLTNHSSYITMFYKDYTMAFYLCSNHAYVITNNNNSK